PAGTRILSITQSTATVRTAAGIDALDVVEGDAGDPALEGRYHLVEGRQPRGDGEVALALACFGGGSMIAALALPRLLERLPDRRVMFAAAISLGGVLAVAAALLSGSAESPVSTLWPGLLATWLLLGLGYSAVQTPSGRLLRRSAHAEDRPAVFAAQFALSHACWLITYPLAGWLGAALPMSLTFAAFALLTLASVLVAVRVWPSDELGDVVHSHDDLPADHPHLAGVDGNRHAHAFVIDDLHREWPERVG
ncbi:MAG: MFS transporter, partial [Bosea sp.]|nr:MFS transporter [Bosea sp. (in: a-proteobacteria)]